MSINQKKSNKIDLVTRPGLFLSESTYLQIFPEDALKNEDTGNLQEKFHFEGNSENLSLVA